MPQIRHRDGQDARYDAFISYSHLRDVAVAKALQAGLETFARPWYRTRVLRVFRDESNLSASPGLWPEIVRALETSSWFVLMASPDAARSPWVQQELAWWLRNRPRDRMLLAWTAGNLTWDNQANDFDWQVTDAVPRLLAGAFAAEPRWVNLSGARDVSSPEQVADGPLRLGDLVAEFAAPIRGMPKDALVGEHHRQRRRLRRTVTAALAALTTLAVTAAVAGVVAYGQRNEARAQARNATARLLASSAEVMAATRLDLAQLLAVEAYRLRGDWQARRTLFRTVTSSPHLVRYLPANGAVSAVAAATDGGAAVAGAADGRVLRWSIATGERTEVGRLPSRVLSVATSADGQTIAAMDGQSVSVWTPQKGAVSLPEVARVIDQSTYDGTGHRVAVSPAGRYVAVADSTSGEERDSVVLHDLTTGKARQVRTGVEVSDLAMPTDAELVVVSAGGRWERRSLPGLTRTVLHDESFMGAHGFNPTVSADGAFFAFDVGAGNLPIWKVDADPEQDRPDLVGRSHGTGALTAAVSRDGSKVAVVDAGTLYVSGTAGELADVGAQRVLPGAATSIPDGLEFVGDGDRLLMASGESVVVWDLSQATRIGRLHRVNLPGVCSGCPPPPVDLSPDGRFAAMVNTSDSVVTVQELGGASTAAMEYTDGDERHRLLGWDASGERLLLGRGLEGAVEFRRVADGLPMVDSWPARSDGYEPTELTADRLGVVERGEKGAIRVRDVRTGQVHQVQPGRATPYKAAVITEVGRDDGTDRKVIATDLASGESHEVGTGVVTTVATGQDLLAIQRDDGTLEVWNRSGTERVAALRQDASFLMTSDKSPPAVAGTLVAQQRTDHSIVLTDFRVREALGTLEPPGDTASQPTSLILTPDARTLVTVAEGDSYLGADGILVQWDLTVDHWIQAACASAGRDLTPDEWRRFVGSDPSNDLRCDR